MSWLIDTSIIAEVAKGSRCDAGVAAWYARAAAVDLHLSVILVGEIRLAASRLAAPDAVRAQALLAWLALVQRAFAGRILPIDDAVTARWGELVASRPVPVLDGLLAATASVHRLTLVTRRDALLTGLAVQLLNPSRPALS